MDEDEVWICYYEAAKERSNVRFLWRAAKNIYVLERLDLQLCERWLNYILDLIKMDQTNAFLIFKNFERRKQEEKEEDQGDECLKLGCYHYMYMLCMGVTQALFDL